MLGPLFGLEHFPACPVANVALACRGASKGLAENSWRRGAKRKGKPGLGILLFAVHGSLWHRGPERARLRPGLAACCSWCAWSSCPSSYPEDRHLSGISIRRACGTVFLAFASMPSRTGVLVSRKNQLGSPIIKTWKKKTRIGAALGLGLVGQPFT